jgi:hypothetical protein
LNLTNKEKATTKDKPKTKHNINPINLSSTDKGINEKSKKGGASKESKPHNQWGIPEEETIMDKNPSFHGIRTFIKN